MTTTPQMSRRGFASCSAAGLGFIAASRGQAAAKRPRRLAQVGTGRRGIDWGVHIIQDYPEAAEIVGLCDINPKRVEAARTIIGSKAPTYSDFDTMVQQTRPEVILVTTTDASHAGYIIRALRLGLDVITEKPLCTDEQQCREILDAERKSGRKLTVAFNARHYPEAKKVKQLLMEGAIGDVVSIDYQEYLDTKHGASYFRRWHRLKQESGTLLVSKSCHHFDQANWWIGSTPADVVARGDLRFYGRNNSFRSTHCRNCPYGQRCPFYYDVTRNSQAMKLFVDCESEDGYQIDGCVWRQDINIFDTYAVMVRYENRARLTYTASTFMPYEGQEIAINGTRGRIDFNMYGAPGFSDHQVRLTRTFGKSEAIGLEGAEGGHGGADPSVRDLIFRGADAPDPLQLRATAAAGAYSSLVGIAGYRSIERGGETVGLARLLEG